MIKDVVLEILCYNIYNLNQIEYLKITLMK